MLEEIAFKASLSHLIIIHHTIHEDITSVGLWFSKAFRTFGTCGQNLKQRINV